MTLSVRGYDILGELYREGTGIVHKARHVVHDRLVALKVLPEESSADAAAHSRVRREAEAMARVTHPHILPIYDLGEQDGKPYLVMQLTEGGSLADRLAGGRLEPRTAVRLLFPITRGLEAVHQAGLVHSDVQPANIRLDGRPDTPLAQCKPYLAGFGLARVQHRGFPPGAADRVPQQGNEIGPASDLWSLGVTLYLCLTGQLPFQGATSEETLHKTLHEPPPATRSLVPGLAPELEAICLKCLEKDPARRYPSAAALAHDLERWLGEPVPS